MPTVSTNTPMTDTWVLVGTGPETVLVSARSQVTEYQHNSAGVVYWVGPTASPPSEGAHGHPVTGPETRSFTLQAGESLWLRGTSKVTAIVTETDLGSQGVASPIDAYGNGTREYGAPTRQAVTGTSARIAIPTLGASRELVLVASTRCFFLTGNSTVVAAPGTSYPLPVDNWLHLKVPAGHTHIAYIRDVADGNVTIFAVV